MLLLQGFHCFIICLLRHCSVLGFNCSIFCLLRHHTISSRFSLLNYLFITPLLCCFILCLLCHYPISSSLGPSLKYVTLEGGKGPRSCDSLWQGRVKSI